MKRPPEFTELEEKRLNFLPSSFEADSSRDIFVTEWLQALAKEYEIAGNTKWPFIIWQELLGYLWKSRFSSKL